MFCYKNTDFYLPSIYVQSNGTITFSFLFNMCQVWAWKIICRRCLETYTTYSEDFIPITSFIYTFPKHLFVDNSCFLNF